MDRAQADCCVQADCAPRSGFDRSRAALRDAKPPPEVGTIVQCWIHRPRFAQTCRFDFGLVCD
jgi:hypothetical protein